MKRCAFLTLSDPAGFVIDDACAVDAFAALGWEVVTVPWDAGSATLSAFDAVVIRSTWDYQHRLAGFLDVLHDIERRGVPLFNPLELVRWNAAKSYLDDLSERGVPVVPTTYLDRLEGIAVAGLRALAGSDDVVLKPLVGGNAQGTFRLRPDATEDEGFEVVRYFADRPVLVQPFVRAVLDEGEYSLFYFDRRFSHAVLKTPAAHDYRVQEEHGGRITSIAAPPALLAAGTAAMDAIPGRPLYSRVDLVRAEGDDGYWLMELELIEPSMYLRMDENAPRRFAEAFVRTMAAP